jgi:SAM-dependent methyltransferase
MRFEVDPVRLALSYDDDVADLWDGGLAAELIPQLASTQGEMVLFAECRTGRFAELTLPALGKPRVMAVDPSRDMLDQARRRLGSLEDLAVYFNCQSAENLSYADGVFSQSFCVAAPRSMPRLDRVVAELNRVTRPGGLMAFACGGASSMSLVYDLCRRVLAESELEDARAHLDVYLERLITVDRLAHLLRLRDAEVLDAGRLEFELNVAPGERLFRSTLVAQTFLPGWREIHPDPEMASQIFDLVGQQLDTMSDMGGLTVDVAVPWVLARASLERVEDIIDGDDIEIVEISEEALADEHSFRDVQGGWDDELADTHETPAVGPAPALPPDVKGGGER